MGAFLEHFKSREISVVSKGRTRKRNFLEMVDAFCTLKLVQYFSKAELNQFRVYIKKLVIYHHDPPSKNAKIDWMLISQEAKITLARLLKCQDALSYLFQAIARENKKMKDLHGEGISNKYSIQKNKYSFCKDNLRDPLDPDWADVLYFHDALHLHMNRYRETSQQLCAAIIKPFENVKHTTINNWRYGKRYPRSTKSEEVLRRIEYRYQLPVGYFKSKLPPLIGGVVTIDLDEINVTERERLKWFLPKNFYEMEKKEQRDIVSWVNSNLLSGVTDYRKFQQKVTCQAFGIRFPRILKYLETLDTSDKQLKGWSSKHKLKNAVSELMPPHILANEMESLIKYKTSQLTPLGYLRKERWKKQTALMRLRNYGLMFGALTSPPDSAIRGLGMSID
jgi:hypothetical protein